MNYTDFSEDERKFYASSQGETHLADSDNGKIMDMKVFGNSEQKKYTGYQLFALAPINKSTGEKVSLPYTENGITIDIANDGIGYTVRGTNTLNEQVSDIYLSMSNAFDIEAGTYTRSGKIINGNSNVELISGGGTSNGGCLEYKANKVDFTFTETVKKGKSGNYVIRISPSATVNAIVYFQIEKGSEAHNFEPYVGGQPSPSLDYPQEIKSVVNPTVKIVGKNLLSYASCELGNTRGIDGTLFASNNYIRSQFVKVCPGKVITLSATEGYVTHKIVEYDANNAMVKNNESGTANVITITLNKNTVKVRTVVMLKEAGVIPDEKDIQIQLEYGITRTAYKPYHEQTVTLPYTLNAIPVSSGGNVTIDGQQYIADYVDVENRKYVQKIGIIQLENINIGTIEDSECTYILEKSGTGILTGKASTEIYNIRCTHFGNNGEIWVSKVNCISWSGGTSQQIRVKTDKSTEELLALLNSGDVYIDYVLAEPVETDLTPEEIQAFKQLATYYPVTNISVNSDQLNGYTVFNYPISMSNGWNYVKQQLNDNRDYIYDMDLQSAEAYVNSEYAVALTELEV